MSKLKALIVALAILVGGTTIGAVGSDTALANGWCQATVYSAANGGWNRCGGDLTRHRVRVFCSNGTFAYGPWRGDPANGLTTTSAVLCPFSTRALSAVGIVEW